MPAKTAKATATKARQSRAGGEKSPKVGTGKPTNLLQRVQRARAIAGERAKRPPTTWTAIAKKFGIGARTAQEIFDDYLSWDVEVKDPLGTVDETIGLFTVMLEQLGHEATSGETSAARVGAVRAMTDIIRERFEMLQAAGRMPRNLSRYRAEAELSAIVRELLDVLERREVPRETLEELKAVAQRHLDQPVAEGNVTPLQPRRATP